jgi:hypothetical protein
VLASLDVSVHEVTPKNATARTAPAIACAIFGATLLRAAGPAAARAALITAPCDPVAHDDTQTISLYADLAAHDALDQNALPIESRIELAWRRREPLRIDLHAVDPRHELLALAQNDVSSPRTLALASKLARRAPSDPIVLAALLAVARAHNQSDADLARAALSSAANPVLDAALLTSLPTSAPERPRVRARFAALAATPAERALAR